MKFITKRMHAYLDYPVAFALVVLPFILGLGSSSPIALYLSLVTGVAALILTILTDHHLGLIKVISYKMHLIVDGLVAVVFVLSPFIFGFSGIDAYYYWINGAMVLLVVGMHKSEPNMAYQ